MRITDSAPQQIFQLLTQTNKGEFSAGDIITGRVIATDNGLIMLMLSDGSKISAQILTGTQYSLGDILNLEIIEEKEGVIYVRQTDKSITPEEVQKSSNENPSLLLKSMGLPVDGRHLEILKAIRETDIEPTADIINDALRLISEGQISDPKQAVFLVSNNMSHRREYFAIVQSFLNGAFNFQEEWADITGDISTLDEKTLMQIAKGLLVNDTVSDLDLTESVTHIIKLYSEPANSSALDSSIRPVVDNLIKNILLNEFVKSEGNINVENTQSLYTTPGINGIVPENAETQMYAGSFDMDTSLNDKMTFDALMKQIFPKYIEDKSRQDEIEGIMKNLLLQVKEKLSGTGLTADKARNIINSSMNKIPEKDTVKSFEANLPKIDKWIRDTERKLYIIKNALVKSENPGRERVQASVDKLDTAISFFQDIISYEAYAQIPLALKEYSTHGDVYIMKRRNKKGKLNPDDFSVFLSLTTVNLGKLDAFINVRNKNVMLRLMAEDEKYFGLMQEEYKSLYEALKEKGYNLYEIKCSLREEGLNILNANKKASELVYMQNKKIDMRI